MDSLGVQGGSIPGLAPGGMVPVLNVGNLGDNFAAQVFESRGVASTWNTCTSLDYLVWNLHSRAAGGTVIENILVHEETQGDDPASVFAPNGYWFLGRNDAAVGSSVTTYTAGSFGGPTPRNSWTAGTDTGIPPLFTWPCRLPPDFDFAGIKLWVPPGQYLNIMFNSVQNLGTPQPSASVTVIWREIPEVQGAAG